MVPIGRKGAKCNACTERSILIELINFRPFSLVKNIIWAETNAFYGRYLIVPTLGQFSDDLYVRKSVFRS